MIASTETLRHGPPTLRKRQVVIAAALVLTALVGAFLFGYLPRRHARSQLVAETAGTQGPPRVVVVKAVARPATRELTLPATLVAHQRTTIYARASGYVRRWLVDIGARVRKGDLLVELETPELNQQLAQARAAVLQKRAALAQMVANQRYARLTAQRNENLVRRELISKQENDLAQTQASVSDANVAAAAADLQAQRALVRQLEQLVSFGRVYAPYDGTITQRLLDVGSLITAGSGANSAALFSIEQSDPMEVDINVPQTFASSVQVGQGARLSVRQFPGRAFTGRVMRTSAALDPASRTLRVEIDVPNPKAELFSGMYAEIALTGSLQHSAVAVPSGAVIQDSRGNHVAVVDGGGKVHLVAVTRGVDNGSTVEVVAGLSGGEQVIATPAGDVAEGMQVQPVSNEG